jgi:hypothetical protein
MGLLDDDSRLASGGKSSIIIVDCRTLKKIRDRLDDTQKAIASVPCPTRL